MKTTLSTLLLFSCILLWAQAPKYVLVLGFDGMSGQGLQKVNTPHFDALRANGAYTFIAEAVQPTVSSPNWASMVNGASPNEHTVKGNEWKRADISTISLCGQPKGKVFPSIFKVLRDQKSDANIAVVHHWDGFARLINKESLNILYNARSEYDACKKTCQIIQNGQPELLFVHFDHVDHAGHHDGHFTEAYYQSIRVADSITGVIMEVLKAKGTLDQTCILITADHGGINKGHGGTTREEIEIPWILSGPGVKKNHKIQGLVHQYDTAATLARLLQLKQPDCWIAKPVTEAFE